MSCVASPHSTIQHPWTLQHNKPQYGPEATHHKPNIWTLYWNLAMTMVHSPTNVLAQPNVHPTSSCPYTNMVCPCGPAWRTRRTSCKCTWISLGTMRTCCKCTRTLHIENTGDHIHFKIDVHWNCKCLYFLKNIWGENKWRPCVWCNSFPKAKCPYKNEGAPLIFVTPLRTRCKGTSVFVLTTCSL